MLENKIVLITGAAGRLGSAFSKGIIENNGKVIISDISSEKGFLLEKELSSPNAVFVQGDTTDLDSIKELILKSADCFGEPINSAIHCAYPTSESWGSKFEDLVPEDLSRDLFSQLGGAILFSQQIILHFLDHGGGDLVHISSIQGVSSPKFEHYQGTNMMSPIEYTAIKSALISITKYLAKYYKQQNIRVNSISPGGILDNQPSSFLKSYLDSCNSKGMLDSKDIVGAILFLLSEHSRFVNGHNIIVDDGWSL